MAMTGDPDKAFGPNGALESLLALLEKAGLKPNRSKFQCPGTTVDALKDAPEWPKPKAIDMRDQESGDVVLNELTGLLKKVYGIVVRGAPISSDVFERSWLAAKADEICSSIDKTTQVLSSRSEKAAHSVIYFSSLYLAD
jgi:hypothetical protein